MDGLSGRIEFDISGQRTNYELDVVQLSYNTPPHKVIHTV